jgi:hypothetical protein
MHGASLAGTSQSATSGSLFKGERLRTYDGPLYFTKEEDLNRNEGMAALAITLMLHKRPGALSWFAERISTTPRQIGSWKRGRMLRRPVLRASGGVS